MALPNSKLATPRHATIPPPPSVGPERPGIVSMNIANIHLVVNAQDVTTVRAGGTPTQTKNGPAMAAIPAAAVAAAFHAPNLARVVPNALVMSVKNVAPATSSLTMVSLASRAQVNTVPAAVNATPQNALVVLPRTHWARMAFARKTLLLTILLLAPSVGPEGPGIVSLHIAKINLVRHVKHAAAHSVIGTAAITVAAAAVVIGTAAAVAQMTGDQRPLLAVSNIMINALTVTKTKAPPLVVCAAHARGRLLSPVMKNHVSFRPGRPTFPR